MNHLWSEATHILTSARESKIALQRLAQSVVPSHADFCFIHLSEGGHLRCAAAAHATRAGRRLVRGLARLYRIKPTDPFSTVAQVVRSGRPLLRIEIPAEDTPGRPRLRVFDLHRRLAPQSAIVVPLASGGRILGAMTLGYADSGRRYRSPDLTRVKRLAKQVATYLSKPLVRRTPSAPKRLVLRARV